MVLPAREWMVLYGRVLPFIRTFISLPAGMARMNFAKFIVLTTIGVSLWVTLLSVIGYELGDSWNKMIKLFGVAGYVIAAVLVVLVAVFMVRRYKRSKVSLVSTQRPDSPIIVSADEAHRRHPPSAPNHDSLM